LACIVTELNNFVTKTNKPVSELVRDYVDFDFSVQDSLTRGYANISALARLIKPYVETKLSRKVKEESIVASLKRMRDRYRQTDNRMREVISGSVLNVRTHVSKISVERTRKTLASLSNILSSYHESLIQVSESISTITLIFDQRIHSKIRKELPSTEILEEGDDYAAIIVQSPREIVETPGCIAMFYSQLARRHINVEDTVSCFTDTIIVVKMENASNAFNALTELINSWRKVA
jgi:aspartokinase